MTVAIIDYGSGNLRSVAKAFVRMGRENVIVTSTPKAVAVADHIVLPGVGAYADCRAGLAAVEGMEEALQKTVIEKGRPFLGICVGMQLLATTGEEFGGKESQAGEFAATAGLNWISGRVKALEPKNVESQDTRPKEAKLKIPHMGWNQVYVVSENRHPVLQDLGRGAYAYFVHSYHFLPDNKHHLLATTPYGQTITAIIGRDNIVGTQFHPEKSQETGLGLIKNFLGWRP